MLKSQFSKFTKDAVEHPVRRRSRNAGTVTDGQSLQVLYDAFDDGELYVWRIWHVDNFRALTGMQLNGCIVEYREGHRPLRSHNEDAIGASALMGDETPRTTARHAILKAEDGTNAILG